MTKQGEKIRFKYEEENYYNSDFSQKLYIYLSENDDKTILDFIKNSLLTKTFTPFSKYLYFSKCLILCLLDI